jgi:hypothetical protein
LTHLSQAQGDHFTAELLTNHKKRVEKASTSDGLNNIKMIARKSMDPVATKQGSIG